MRFKITSQTHFPLIFYHYKWILGISEMFWICDHCKIFTWFMLLWMIASIGSLSRTKWRFRISFSFWWFLKSKLKLNCLLNINKTSNGFVISINKHLFTMFREIILFLPQNVLHTDIIPSFVRGCEESDVFSQCELVQKLVVST